MCGEASSGQIKGGGATASMCWIQYRGLVVAGGPGVHFTFFGLPSESYYDAYTHNSCHQEHAHSTH